MDANLYMYMYIVWLWIIPCTCLLYWHVKTACCSNLAVTALPNHHFHRIERNHHTLWCRAFELWEWDYHCLVVWAYCRPLLWKIHATCERSPSWIQPGPELAHWLYPEEPTITVLAYHNAYPIYPYHEHITPYTYQNSFHLHCICTLHMYVY